MGRPDPRSCFYCASATEERGLPVGAEFQKCCKTHDPARYVCADCWNNDEACRADHDPQVTPLVEIEVTYTLRMRADDFYNEHFGPPTYKPERPTAADLLATLKEHHPHGKFDFVADSDITLGDPKVEIGVGPTRVEW